MTIIDIRRFKLGSLMAAVAFLGVVIFVILRTPPGHDPQVVAWRGWVAALSERERASRLAAYESVLRGQDAKADELGKKAELLANRLKQARKCLAANEATCCRICWVRSWFHW